MDYITFVSTSYWYIAVFSSIILLSSKLPIILRNLLGTSNKSLVISGWISLCCSIIITLIRVYLEIDKLVAIIAFELFQFSFLFFFVGVLINPTLRSQRKADKKTHGGILKAELKKGQSTQSNKMGRE